MVAIGPGLGARRTSPRWCTRWPSASTARWCWTPTRLVRPGLAACPAALRILTPHPGEMARLTGKTTAEIQADRIGAARDYATEHGVTLVLKGQRTLIAFPDGRVWINPTGTPAMGTGGSGDILTGMIAGLLAQFPGARGPGRGGSGLPAWPRRANSARRRSGEKCLIATDLLQYLPDAMEECAGVPHRV